MTSHEEAALHAEMTARGLPPYQQDEILARRRKANGHLQSRNFDFERLTPIDFGDFLALSFPPRELVLSPWLPQGGDPEHRQKREKPADDEEQARGDANPAGVGVTQHPDDPRRAIGKLPFEMLERLPQNPLAFGQLHPPEGPRGIA
jgi:hypothetical protein